MKYVSIFSGIEAATVAWQPLGWEPLAFSEIDPFPSTVLQHHYRFCFGEKAASPSVSRMNRLSLLLPVYVAFDYAFAVSSHGFAIVSGGP